MLANSYPSASGKESVYVTNQSLGEVLQYQKFYEESISIEKNINVLTALVETNKVSQSDLLDYSYRCDSVNTMAFDLYSRTIDYREAFENFISVINKLGNRFIVMDLNGDVNSNELKCILSECDVVLYTFNPSIKDVNKAKEVFSNLSEEEKVKFKLVCTKYNNLGLSKKSIQDVVKVRANSILWFPYHYNIEQTMYERRLCILNKLMIEGRDSCISFRQPIKDILSFVCDIPTTKVIREVGSWVF